MLAECLQENCTVATTGQCLLNHDPAATCPHYRLLADSAGTSASDELSDELLDEPDQNPSFQLSNTLTEDSLSTLMGSRYCTVVGIVGPPDSGKTAALVSLYLLLSHGRLDGFEYADSKSLVALDEISRGARRWIGGTPPEHMTTHTELSDDRAAGFLHLRLRSSAHDRSFELLLPDLPGEWSTAMVEESRHERMAFLARADVIWLMVDGNRLSHGPTRQAAIHRTKLYLQRLKQFFPDLPRVILVTTRADSSVVSTQTLDVIAAEAASLGIDMSVQPISSFSMNEQVSPGTGISSLLSRSLGVRPEITEFWPTSNRYSGPRAISNITRGGVDT